LLQQLLYSTPRIGQFSSWRSGRSRPVVIPGDLVIALTDHTCVCDIPGLLPWWIGSSDLFPTSGVWGVKLKPSKTLFSQQKSCLWNTVQPALKVRITSVQQVQGEKSFPIVCYLVELIVYSVDAMDKISMHFS
jgi:hypothetical protein